MSGCCAGAGPDRQHDVHRGTPATRARPTTPPPGGPDRLHQAVAKEIGSRSITCNAVAPGYVRTELTRASLNDEIVTELVSGRRCSARGPRRTSPPRSRSSARGRQLHHRPRPGRRRRPVGLSRWVAAFLEGRRGTAYCGGAVPEHHMLTIRSSERIAARSHEGHEGTHEGGRWTIHGASRAAGLRKAVQISPSCVLRDLRASVLQPLEQPTRVLQKSRSLSRWSRVLSAMRR